MLGDRESDHESGDQMLGDRASDHESDLIQQMLGDSFAPYTYTRTWRRWWSSITALLLVVVLLAGHGRPCDIDSIVAYR